MARTDPTSYQQRLFVIVCGVTIIAALYFAKEILLPIALAILLTFLLAPLVDRLERWKIGRIPAVLMVVLVSFAGFLIVSYVLAQQVYDLAYRLPDYRVNILNKARAFQTQGEGVLSRITGTFKDIQQDLTNDAAPAEQPPASQPPGPFDPPAAPSPNGALEPQPVKIVNELSARDIAQGVLGPLVAPVGTAALVIIFVVFMLLEREDMRNRFIRLVGSRSLHITTEALTEAGLRVSRYLRMQLLINVLFGFVIAVGLFFIGLPNAILWGAMATALRFVPYLGPWIAATIPFAVSLAVFDGWSRPLFVLALFALNELVSNNVMEPWLYGASTGISTIGIILSAVFWTWLWGPVGLILATPLTVCLTVVGKHVPHLEFLNTLLADHEVLPPQTRFYQRLLAGDLEEALEIAEDYLQANSLESLYDSVLLPALSMAEQDHHRGALDDARQQFILQTVRELIDDLAARPDLAAREDVITEADSSAQAAAVVAEHSIVLCLPARDEADEIAGLMLVHFLRRRGVSAEVLSSRRLTGEMLAEVEERDAQIICVSSLPPYAATHARYVCKRLRPKFPNAQIVVGLWQTSGAKKAQERLASTGVDRFVTSLAEATEQIGQLVAGARPAAPAGNDEGRKLPRAG